MEHKGAPHVMDKVRDFLGKNFILVVFCGVGLLLVVFSNIFFSSDSSEKKQVAEEKAEDIAADYVAQISGQLKGLLKSIEGVGECEVMLTVESSTEYVYVAEEKKSEQRTEETTSGHRRVDTKKDSDETYIIIDDGDGQKALVKTTLLPRVKGVVVLCKGADDPGVKLRVIEAVTTVFGISSNKVCVVKKS